MNAIETENEPVRTAAATDRVDRSWLVSRSCAVLAVALMTRLGVFFLCVHGDYRRTFVPDSGTYHRPALNLLHHQFFSQYDLREGTREPDGPLYLMHGGVKRVIATRGPYLPEVFRTPGYPIFLSAIYGVFGERPLTAIFWQCCLGASTCLLVLLTGVIAGVPRAGGWGGFILALDPGSVLNSNLVITETLGTWLVAASLLLLAAFWRRARLGYLFAAGLLLGLSILSRPAGTYLPVLVAIWIVLFAARTWRSSAAGVGLLLLGLAIPLVPWAARNHTAFGVWQLSSIQGLNLFFCKAADLESNSLGDQERSNAALQTMEAEIRPAIEERARNQLEMAQLYQTFAIQRIVRQPVPYARLHALGTMKLLLANHAREFYQLNGWKHQETGLLAMILGSGEEAGNQSGRDWFALSLAIGETCWLLALYGLAVLALWRGWRIETTALLVLLVMATLYSVVLPGPEGIARFRVPAMPPIALLVGLGVGRLRMLSFKRSSAVGVG